MKVKELIDQLSKHDGDMPVCVSINRRESLEDWMGYHNMNVSAAQYILHKGENMYIEKFIDISTEI